MSNHITLLVGSQSRIRGGDSLAIYGRRKASQSYHSPKTSRVNLASIKPRNMFHDLRQSFATLQLTVITRILCLNCLGRDMAIW